MGHARQRKRLRCSSRCNRTGHLRHDDAQEMFAALPEEHDDAGHVQRCQRRRLRNMASRTPMCRESSETCPYTESLAFFKQIVPKAQNAAASMTAYVPPGIALRTQVESEKSGYPMTMVAGFHLIRDNAARSRLLAVPARRVRRPVVRQQLEGISRQSVR